MRMLLCLVLFCLYLSPALAETPVERGRYIVEVIGACGNCHTPNTPEGKDQSMHLAGGSLIPDGGMEAWPSNITQDVETGIGAWTDEEIIRAIREGIRPNDRIIGPMMPIGLYREISDSDARAIVAYLRTVKAVRNTVPESKYPFPLPASYGPPLESVPDPDRNDPVAYGEYLAGPLGHCIECHSAPGETGAPDHVNALGAGGLLFHGPWGVSSSANITPNGIGHKSDAEIRQMITTGIRADGSKMLPPMGYGYYANLTDDDLAAIIAYLRTLPPK